MRSIPAHLDNIREKPHHIRRQFAFVFAIALTGVVGLFWLGISLSTGAFALKDTNFAQATGADAGDPTLPDNPAVAGAAAALPSDQGPARIEVVKSAAPTTVKKVDAASSGGSTVIPF